MQEWTLDPSSLCPGLTGGAYDYSILIDQVEAGSFLCESYGAAVTSRHTGERAAVPNITVSVPRIDALMELLIRNQVSPLHLRDVIDDWL